ncbi:MAG: 4-hydroxy-3-methylbut-2-enyl diphosphate reductase [Acidobacteria bacterium]|nr:4-hydroxy-3-methylbut-2-enyl diphosphate reductase [Acidobacteriota bacterium]MBI3658694.1 4-hydroxy-3-methylbut-2-enyl diphosphate reductase [Acidobacteriota bacterium]
MVVMENQTYFQKGFGLKALVGDMLKESYHSQIVEFLRSHSNRLQVGEVTIQLAKEFGFCYGVERAVEYAYETIKKFPDRQIYLTGEIIHNPYVNASLRQLGIRFLSDNPLEGPTLDYVTPDDVVLIPAFGISREVLEELHRKGCVIVDTTCGSVLNVWKNVEKYARLGFTSIVHGKHEHEETKATCSRARQHTGGQYLVVRDLAETNMVCQYIVNGGNSAVFLSRFAAGVSPGFDPERHLQKVGLANQTTMLSSESLEVAELLRKAMQQRYGTDHLDEHFCSFDTICSATQDRQDAVLKMVAVDPPDLIIVIGGYNSSNTNNLTKIATKYTVAYHIEDPGNMMDRERILHKPVGRVEQTITEGWLPYGPLSIGVTAGASTPNNKIGEAIERILTLRGYDCGDKIFL